MEITSVDFINTYISKLCKKGIYTFNKIELITQYNFFMEQYPELFSNDPIKNNIELALFHYIQCGYLFDANGYDLYVTRLIGEKYVNQDLNVLMNYYVNTKILSTNYQNLIIYLTKAENKYITLKGKKCSHNIEWKLFTDGIEEDHYLQLVKGKKHTFKSPFICGYEYFKEADFKYIIVKDASYVLQQEYIDNKLNANVLYTSTNNIYEVTDIAKKYCKRSR